MTPNSMWIAVGVALVIIALVVLFSGSRITGNYVRGRVDGDINQIYSPQSTQGSASEQIWITAVGWLLAIIGVGVSAYGVFGKK
jgi:hypothetical protein